MHDFNYNIRSVPVGFIKILLKGMIVVRGIGVDIVEIERIKKLIIKYSSHFLEKVFTPHEIAFCNQKANPANHFAGRWAAKEAFYKALPLPFQHYSTWKSIEVIPDKDSGRPEIRILSQELGDCFKTENISSILLSISHERMICTATVILE